MRCLLINLDRSPERLARMAAAWDAWAKASYVDPWREEYDVHYRDPRQNWGGGGNERPKLPQAMDAMTDEVRAVLARPAT